MLVAACLVLVWRGLAQTTLESPVRNLAAASAAPSGAPDRIVLTWLDDPATTQAVTWRTSKGGSKGIAEIQEATDGVLGGEVRRVEATDEPGELKSESVRYHTVQFTGLRPGTIYAYRVGDGGVWSEWFHFHTGSREAARFSFIYFGDAQNDIKAHWSRVAREAFRREPLAAFTLHAGDLVNRGDNDSEWGEWFGGLGWANAMVPVVAAAGNHEYITVSGSREDKDRVRSLAGQWRRQFAFPADGPAGLEETCYYFDYQGARVVVLNSNEKYEAQASWLREVLRHNPMRWTILTFHHPFFSPSAKRTPEEDEEQLKLRECWQPVFDEFHVDLVLNGHDHTYARSDFDHVPLPVTAGRTNGTIYVVSVSGPKMYRLGPAGWAVRVAQATQLYQIITVDGDQLHYESRTAINKLYDGFSLVKHTSGRNELRELLLPERRDVALPVR